MEKRGLLFTHEDIFTLGQTNCMGNVTHYQYDILFGYIREKWALITIGGLLQSLGKELNLETVETHKFLKKSFYLGDEFRLSLYVQSLTQASFIFTGEFFSVKKQEVYAIVEQKIVATRLDGKPRRIPDELRQVLAANMV